MLVLDSPADVLAQIIAAGAIGISRPVSGSSTAPWQITVGNMPPDPVDRVSVVDMSGIKFGRNMRTGMTEEAPGVIVYLRSNKYLDGWTKCWQIKNLLDQVKNDTVVLRGRTYTVGSCRKTSGPMFIGQEENQTSSNFTLNYLLTIS